MRKSVFDDRQAAPDLKRKFLPSAVVEDKTLGERQIRVVVSTPSPDRVKDVMEPSGVDLSAYKNNPIVLADHNREAPIGTAEIEVKSDRVEAIITFAPAGASAKADEYCALAKAGVLNTVSPGFIEKEATPIKGGGYHIKNWELLELSLVSVPCNAEATVIERKLPERAWRVGASLNLPFAATDAKGVDILDAKTLDPKTAHKGFLAYDAGAAGKAEGYAIPFARMVDGRLMVDAKTLKSARAALASAAFPDDVATKAAAVLDHYESKVDAARPARRIKGLYDVACLAGVLADLGWIEDMAEMEAEWEGDNSPVPQMLTDAMRALGAALIAMTVEEVSELLGDEADDTQSVAMSSEKSAKAFARKLNAARTKAGRALSKATSERIAAACKMIESGHADLKAMIAETETPAEDAGEDEATESKPDTGKAAPTLTQRERDLDLLKLKKAR